MNIEKVYCVEMGEVVDIYRARNFYFSQKVHEELTFLCSDEKCRKAGTEVVGVNYRKLIEEGDKFVRPHFRKHSDHIPDCEWVERDQASRESKEEVDNSTGQIDIAKGRSKTPKSTDVIDIFEPNLAADARQSETIPREIELQIKSLKDPNARVEAYKNYFRKNPSRTSILENVVGCYDAMNYEAKTSTTLVIRTSQGKRELSYADAVRHIRNYTPGLDEEVIWFGGAKVLDMGNVYWLSFIDRVVFKEEKHQITLYIKKSDLTARKRQAYLLEMLKDLADDKENKYARCFFYGCITPSMKARRRLDVTIAHLNNLVVMKKSKQQQ
jgi:hypothetical protein